MNKKEELFVKTFFCLLHICSSVILCFFLMSQSLVAKAQDITYDGTNPGLLQTLPAWAGGFNNAFFPGTTIAPLANGNRLWFVGGTAAGVFGGLSENGSVANNSVNFSGGNINKNIYGGYSINGDVNSNSISASSLGTSVGGGIFGGYSETGDVKGNNVTMSHIALTGCWTYSKLSYPDVDGSIFGAFSVAGEVANNTVVINGGNVNFDIIGGFSDTGKATNNTIIINSGNINRNIYTGYSYDNDATGNTLTIDKNVNLSIASNIYGGYSLHGSDAITGNTFNINGWQGTVHQIENFQYYNFILPDNISHGQTQIHTTLGPTDINNDTFKIVGVLDGSNLLSVGDQITLMDNLSGVPAPLMPSNNVKKGSLVIYDFDLAFVDTFPHDKIIATLTNVTINQQCKSLSEGWASGMAFVNMGADLAAEQGINSACDVTDKTAEQIGFSAIGGGSSRYNTGSHVDIDGFSLLTGIARRYDTKNGQQVNALFIENGWGNYDAYNSFTSAANTHGSGNTSYHGLGMLHRSEAKSGLYWEGSLRIGRSKTDFTSADMENALGDDTNYDSTSTYYGVHLGIGRSKVLNNGNVFDLYSKYFFTHLEGDDVIVSGSPVSFASSNSHRWRNGVKLSLPNKNNTIYYIGAAYEYEFDGDAKASVYCFDVPAPSLRGGSGLFEVGVKYKHPQSRFVIAFGLQGYVGKREGLSGSLQFNYGF